ncbi:nitrilase-related carbon-nitrogen hydrolase [Bradyrhizobium sp. cf659]|uniref:nitrilase-related carbon-nitrogen hydrolase n=1 Tax=Bradyrhizobium sp. cf659 TaxID=1761771 RepID=UPI001FCDC0D1|nr:nitrilase-related carbon-nitrogen hydrolase [Bradyrhizobium sp. cf659]
MLKLPRFRAAAVQASPVYLNAGATADKAASLVREAAANGAKLVAFPEVFVPGYPTSHMRIAVLRYVRATNSSCPGLSRASTFFVPRERSWMAGTQASEATPSFRRLCPAMTVWRRPPANSSCSRRCHETGLS